MASRDGAKPFDIVISVDNTPNEKIECKVVITNNGDEDLLIRVENTPFEWLGHPLEGKTSDNFHIIHEGNVRSVQFNGIMVKRRNESDPLLITKKSSKVTTVRLADSYSFDRTRSALYTVQLRTTLYYHASGANEKSSQAMQSNQQFFSLEENIEKPVQYKVPCGITTLVKDHSDLTHGKADTKVAFDAAHML